VAQSYDFGVKASSGTVTLTGAVPSDEERELADRLAASVSGVRAIANDVVVKRAIVMPSDQKLADQVRSRLAWDVEVPHGIKVHAHHGKVSLSGTVCNEIEKSRALSDARVQGARSVDGSGLTV